MTNQLLYDVDFYAWASKQASLLRAGRGEKRELVSRLTILLLHRLKWQFRLSHRGVSWRALIDNERDDIADHLKDNPSLQSLLVETMVAAYRRARRQAAGEIGLAAAVFPLSSPWPVEQMMDGHFWLEAT